MSDHDPVLRLRGLGVQYRRGAGLFGSSKQVLNAVRDLDLDIASGESVGLVGESGSGKSTVAQAIEGLLKPATGSIEISGRDLTSLGKADVRGLRRHFQMVFQDPYSSLDPSMSIAATLIEPFIVHKMGNRAEARAAAVEALTAVGLREADLAKYPHEFSGGQRQRIAIARALVPNPELLILDEAVSALDVSTRAQVLRLLEKLRSDRGLAYLFIGHDLAVVNRMSDRIAVMYLGRILEFGEARQIVESPRHPYTAALLRSVPDVRNRGDRQRGDELIIKAEPPDPWNPPEGCPFIRRCPFAMEKCTTMPDTQVVGEGTVRCHLVNEGQVSEATSVFDLPVPAVRPIAAQKAERQ